jgi:hypothetical protein
MKKMKEEKKKIDFTFDVNQHLKDEIKNSKYLKYTATAFLVVGGILAVGFASKVFNYAIGNIKNLKDTLKK